MLLVTVVFIAFTKIMSPPVSPEVKGRILALKGQKKSAFIVQRELLGANINVSISTINHLWKKKLIGGPEVTGNLPGIKRRRRKIIRTPEVIKKVKQMIKSDNPRTQMVIGKRVGISQQRISEIIKEDLGMKRLKKRSAKHLTDEMVDKRKKRAKKFKKLIEGDQLKYLLTEDEAMLPLDYTNGETDHYYALKNNEERDRPAPLATSAQQFPEQYMMAWTDSFSNHSCESKSQCRLFHPTCVDTNVRRGRPKIVWKGCR